jgi:hypothetical protein
MAKATSIPPQARRDDPGGKLNHLEIGRETALDRAIVPSPEALICASSDACS